MALDVGDARVGIAISDPLLITAQPLETVDTPKACARIVQICVDKSVGKIIVGLPKMLDGSIGEQAEKVTKFVDNLQSALDSSNFEGIEVQYWDERLTTKQAERVLAGSKLKNREKSAALDRISAALILQSYLDSGGFQIS
jgi:putative Holliday junction resolvase